MNEITRNVFVELEYDEVNVGAIISSTGVICIDAPSYARDARDWAARMHRLSPYPVQHVLLTDASGDRVLNTRWLNAPLTMHRAGAELLSTYDKKYPQAIIDSLVTRSPHRSRELNNTQVEQPTTNFTGEMIMYKHGHTIVLKQAGGPTLSSAWVMLPERDIIFTGDTLMLGTHPHLNAPTSAAWIASMQSLKEKVQTHTIVPGRGSNVSAEAIDASIAYLQQMRDHVSEAMTHQEPREAILAQVDAFVGMFPLNDYPPHWVQQRVRASLGYVYNEVTFGQSSLEQLPPQQIESDSF